MKAFFYRIFLVVQVLLIWTIIGGLCAGALWASGAGMKPGPALFQAYMFWCILSLVASAGSLGFMATIKEADRRARQDGGGL